MEALLEGFPVTRLAEGFSEKQSVVQTLKEDSHCHPVYQLGPRMLMQIPSSNGRSIFRPSFTNHLAGCRPSYLPQLCEATA